MADPTKPDDTPKAETPRTEETPPPAKPGTRVPEIGGRKGLDPTRYGDWEKDGRCVDF